MLHIISQVRQPHQGMQKKINYLKNLNVISLAMSQFLLGLVFLTIIEFSHITLEMFKDSFEEELCILTAARKWKEILRLSESLPLEKKNKYLWTWPTGCALNNLKSTLQELDIVDVLSIGCGTGLLEWIIQESIGISIFGLEIDRSWWESSYSPTSFIKLNFMDTGCMKSKFLQECCDTKDWDFALLFCFFNNGKAFQEYLRLYKGSNVIIIGPAPGVGIHTDPAPLTPGFCDSKWKLSKSFNISNNDIIAFYTIS